MVLVPSWTNIITVKRKLTRQEKVDSTLFFHNLVLFNLIKINHKAFIAKAKGSPDSFGDTWKPLKEQTIAWKKKKKLVYAGKVAINIRSKRLLSALKPNVFQNGVYIPSPEQVVRVNQRSIYFSVKVEYADEVDSVRNIFVKDLDALVEEAVKVSIPEFQKYFRKRGL
jgi:hypothetical protein